MIILIRQITNSYLIKNYEGLGSSRQHRTFCTHRGAGHAQNHQQGGKRNICFFYFKYQVNVIDFPGSNSLDYHGKTFSICGAMNNLVIVILPFTGDVSALVSEEVAKVFQVILSVLQKVGSRKTFSRT